jgi:hypothetical protein
MLEEWIRRRRSSGLVVELQGATGRLERLAAVA